MNILTIDGGGIRGLIPALILAEIEEKTGKPISSLFDLIAGTSTGGLLAIALSVSDVYGKPKLTAKEMVDIYLNRSDEIFKRSIFHRLQAIDSIRDEKYQKDGFINILDDLLGATTMKDTLTEIIIPAYETERRIPWFFKSIHAKNPEKKNYDFFLKDIALATSAAPTYFEPHKVKYEETNYLSFVDGGLFANNPTMCALIDAKVFFGKDEKEVNIVSLGTGQMNKRYDFDDIKDWGLINWARPVIDCTFDGMNDTVDYQVNKLVPKERYFRFQTELINSSDELDDISDNNLRGLRLDAENLLHKEFRKFHAMLERINPELDEKLV